MQARIQHALQMSLESATIMHATQELEELRLLPDFTINTIPLLTTELSLPAMIQIALANRNFVDRQPQPYVEIAMQLLEISSEIPAATVAKMSDFLSQLIAHLFETDWFTSISELAQRFINQNNVIAFDCIARCFERYKHVNLNDEVASKLLILLQESEPAVKFALTSYQPAYSSLLAILESAYTWEDLPDFYCDNYPVILDLLREIAAVQSPERFLQLVSTVTEALANHSEELTHHLAVSVEFLIQCLNMRLLDRDYEVVIAKLLTKISSFVASPELQQLMGAHSDDLSRLAFSATRITEEDYEAVRVCDEVYLQCYQARFDFNSRKEAAEQLLKELCACCPDLLAQLQKIAMQPITLDNLCQQVSLFRIIAIQTFSRLFGMRLNVEPVVVQQFAQLLEQSTEAIESIADPQCSLVCSTVIKFVADFYNSIAQDTADALLLKMLALYYASKDRFFNKNVAAVVIECLSGSEPRMCFVDEKLLNKLLDESQNDLNSDIEINAVYLILKQVVKQLTQQAQEEFMQNLLHLLEFAITNRANQSYLHYLCETIGCFITNCKFDNSIIFRQFVQLSNQVGEEQLLEISPFIYQLFTLCSDIQLLLPVFYESITLENYQYYPDMIPALLFFAETFIKRHTRFESYERPKELLRLTDEFDSSNQNAIRTIEMLLPQIIQMPSKAGLGLKFLNNLHEVQGFQLEETFLQQVAEFLCSNRQYVFLNRQYLKHASIFLLEHCKFVTNIEDIFLSFIKPAATTFGLRDVFKQRYCSAIISMVEQYPQLHDLAVETIGISLGKSRTRNFLSATDDEKDQTVNAVSLLESCSEKVDALPYAELLRVCEQALGVTRWE